MPDETDVLRRLEADGLLRRDEQEYRTTRRWQSAMARAALALYRKGDPGQDLRTPVAYALLEFYGTELSSEEIAGFVLVMAPLEARELDPQFLLTRARSRGAGEMHE